MSSDFPLTRKVSYLNTAGIGLIPVPVVKELQQFAAMHLSKPPYGEAFYEFLDLLEETRKTFARFINCSQNELSFQTSASMGVSLVGEIIPWRKRDQVLIDDLQFPSGIYPWMNLASRGVKLRVVKSRNGRVDPSDYERASGKQTKLIAASMVSYVNGFTHDLGALGEIAKQHDAYFLVDATQAAGYLDIDVRDCKADFLVTSNHKWLMSTFGAAELFIRNELIENTSSPHVGWFSTKNYRNPKANFHKYEPARNARKFEPGSPDYLSIFCLSESLRYIQKIGVSRIRGETRKLHQRLMDGLLAMNVDLLTPADSQYWSGIVFCRSPRISGSKFAERLKKRKIYVTPRVFKDFDGIRISPYFYNTVEEIDHLLHEIRKIQESVKH